jgi:hypothetical protein
MRIHQVGIEFTGKSITAWGGLAMLLGKYFERISFREWVEAHVPIREVSPNGLGVYAKVLAQMLTVLVGGSRFSHLGWWGHGVEAIQAMFGVSDLPCSSTTLTRFWGKIRTQGAAESWGVAGRSFARAMLEREGIVEDNLTMDSHVMVRYGEQEGAKKGYNPKKPGRASHHPLLAFVGAGYVVNCWNRSGNTASAQGAVDFFRQTEAAMGADFRIRWVLGDSGFYHVALIEHLERQGHRYILAVPISWVLQKAIQRVPAWREIDPGIEVCDFWFEHLDSKWTHPRRYVAVRQSIGQRPKATGKQPALLQDWEPWPQYRLSLMITSDATLPPEEIWRLYRPRANDENVLKDLEEGYRFGAFNMDSFWATEAVMVLNALVFHNLIHHLNRTILHPHGPRPQLKTLRSRYFILPAFLGTTAGSPVLRMAVRDRSFRAHLRYLMQRLHDLVPLANCIAFAEDLPPPGPLTAS